MKGLSIKTRRRFSSTLLLASLLVTGLLLFPGQSFCQEKTDTLPNGTDGLVNVVRSLDSSTRTLPPNEFKGSLSTFKIGLGYIYDAATYIKSDVFQKQLDWGKLVMNPAQKPRDFQILGSGVLNTKRYLSWKFAFMYDGDKETWMVRESGLTIGVPELSGNIFIGRTMM